MERKKKLINERAAKGIVARRFISAVAVLFILFGLTAPAYAAADITFAWDACPDNDLAGYRIYQSTTSGQYSYGAIYAVATVNKEQTTATITVPDGTYFWVVAAYDNFGNESELSNEVTLSIDYTAPAAPKNFRKTSAVKHSADATQ